MSTTTFMDKLKVFFGIRQEPPRNDFRNPIWGSDDDDDGDELYTRHQIEPYVDPTELHRHITSQMQDMFKSFGSIFGDVKLFFQDDQFDSLAGFGDVPEPEGYSGSNNLREYYLKPGYQNQKFDHSKQDIDLDGKISSHEISGLLKQKEDGQKEITPFDGNLVPGRSFCRTIITTSVTKPDGTIETKRIIKNGNEIIEETTTSTGIDNKGPFNSSLDPISSTSYIYNSIMSELSSHFRNFSF
ncbi:unnamed protein product [Chilo suppressalis]|uniref:EF-hand domain-containing protein n=1 Tax=Chilo suppressalis TaxID=168631 RepID=A0ABN8AWN0_CHISP|nr:unnamed protein product [Chilo suppressalis]